jgi:hypothetical protein
MAPESPMLWRVGSRAGALDLRDTFQGVVVGALDIFGVGLVRSTKSLWRLEESVLAVDPATGQEKWRRLVEQHRAPSTTSEQTMRLVGGAGQVQPLIRHIRAPRRLLARDRRHPERDRDVLDCLSHVFPGMMACLWEIRRRAAGNP